MGNEADFWFTMMYFGIPIFLIFIGIMSCERGPFLGALHLACTIEIVFDAIFAACIVSKTTPLTPEEIHQKPIVGCLFLGAVLLLCLANEASGQQGTAKK